MSLRDASPEWWRQTELLRALLFDAGARDGFCRGEGSAEDALFRHTETEQVRRTGEKITADVLRRSRRGAQAVAKMYRRTLAHWEAEEEGRSLRELLERFVASEPWARHGEDPGCATQWSLEEAFYRFACEADVGEAETRRVEFLEAMMRALAVQPRPAFRVPDEIEQMEAGPTASCGLRGRRVVFAVREGRLIRGVVGDEPSSAQAQSKNSSHTPSL
jgi:hypothetical protein